MAKIKTYKTRQHRSIKTKSIQSSYAGFGVKKWTSMHVARTHASSTWEAFPIIYSTRTQRIFWHWVIEWFFGLCSDSRSKSQAVAAEKLCSGLTSICNMYVDSKWHVLEVDSQWMDLRRSWQFKTPQVPNRQSATDGPSHPSERPANSLFNVLHLWPAAQPPGKTKANRSEQMQTVPMVQSISKCFKNSCPRARGHFLHNCYNLASQDHCSLSQIELLQAIWPIFINLLWFSVSWAFCREKVISAFRLVLKGITLRSVQLRPWFGCR